MVKLDITEFWKGCLGLSVYLWCVLPIPPHLPIQNWLLGDFWEAHLKGKWNQKSWNPTSTHPKLIFDDFWKETLKGTWDKKTRNPRSYPPKFILGALWEGNFERNMGQEKQESKIYHPRFILTSAVPGQVRKTIDRIYSRAMDTTEFWKGCLGLSVYLWCVLPIPLHLPIRNSFLGDQWLLKGPFERKTE